MCNRTKVFQLFNSLVRSLPEYGSIVWRPHFAVHCLQLERVQKRFLWHLAFANGISKRKWRIPYSDRLARFKMMSVSKRFELADASFVWKLLNHCIDSPPLLAMINLRVPSRYPRHKITPLSVPFRRTAFGSNSPIPRLCRLVNEYSNILDFNFDLLGSTLRVV